MLEKVVVEKRRNHVVRRSDCVEVAREVEIDFLHWEYLGIPSTGCTTQGPNACGRATCCEALPMWEKLDQMIDAFFEGITIADLLKK